MRALVTALLVLVAGTAGSWLLLLQRLRAKADPVTCEMTFSYTSYLPVPLPHQPRHLRRYQLLLYREGGGPHQGPLPTGYPALFVPGNAGSYQQVRSLASETARLAARIPGATDIDWYVVDLREELSAFDGTLLQQQTAFVRHVLAHLSAVYNLTASPAASSLAGGGILLLGHSMGGVVARAALAQQLSPPQPPGQLPHVAALLLLASPQQYSPVQLAPGLAAAYRRLNSHPLPAGLPVLSINGGSLDLQVTWRLTLLAGRVLPAWGLAASSGEVPGVWADAGHNQVAWCNQLIRRLGLLLLEMVVPRNDSSHNGSNTSPQPQKQHGRRVLAGDAAAAHGGAHTRGVASHAAMRLDISSRYKPLPSEALILWQPHDDSNSSSRSFNRRVLAAAGYRRHLTTGHRWAGVAPAAVAASAGSVQVMALARAYLTPRLLQALAAQQLGVRGLPTPPAMDGSCDVNAAAAAGQLSGQVVPGSLLRAGCAGVIPQPPLFPRPPDVCGASSAATASSSSSSASDGRPAAGMVVDAGPSCHGSPVLGVVRRGALAHHLAGPHHQWRGWVKQWLSDARPQPPADGPSRGVFLRWDAASVQEQVAAGNSLLVLVGAALPCTGWRLWVKAPSAGCTLGTGPVTGSSNTSSNNSNNSTSSWHDITSQAAPLPPLWDEHRYRVRIDSDWQVIMAGRDYLGYSTWALHLPATWLQGARGVALWVAPTTTLPSEGLTLDTTLAWQWMAPRPPPLTLSWPSWLRPHRLPQGGPALVRLVVPLVAWMAPTFVTPNRVGRMPMNSSNSNSSDTAASSGGGPLSCHAPALVFVAADRGEALAANLSAGVALAELAVAAPPGWAAPAGELLLLRDSGCEVRVGLTIQLLAALPPLLLTWGSTAVGLMAALLLLVLSHQMSALMALTAGAAGQISVSSSMATGLDPASPAHSPKPPIAAHQETSSRPALQWPGDIVGQSMVSLHRSALLAAAAAAAGGQQQAAAAAAPPAPRASLGGGPPSTATLVPLSASILAVLGDRRVAAWGGSLLLACWALSCAATLQQQAAWLQLEQPQGLALAVGGSAAVVQRVLLRAVGLWPVVIPPPPLWGCGVLAGCGLAALLAGWWLSRALRCALAAACGIFSKALQLGTPDHASSSGMGGVEDVRQGGTLASSIRPPAAACLAAVNVGCSTCYSLACMCGPAGCSLVPTVPTGNSSAPTAGPLAAPNSLWQCWAAWRGVQEGGSPAWGWLAAARLAAGGALCAAHPAVGLTVATALLFYSWQPSSTVDTAARGAAAAAVMRSAAAAGQTSSSTPPVPLTPVSRLGKEFPDESSETVVASPRAAAALQLDEGAQPDLQLLDTVEPPSQAIQQQVVVPNGEGQAAPLPRNPLLRSLARAASVLPPLWRWESGVTAAALGARVTASRTEWQGTVAAQLSNPAMGGWLLWYGLGLVVAAPSAVAWLELPPGQQPLSRPIDALFTLPVLAHAAALAQRRLPAFVGTAPVSTAASPVAEATAWLYKVVLRLAAVYVLLAAMHGYSSCVAGLQAVVAALLLSGDVLLAVVTWWWGRRGLSEHQVQGAKFKAK